MSCAQISVNTLRYDLLIVAVPAGAVLAGLRHRVAAVRAGLVAAMLVWIAVKLVRQDAENFIDLRIDRLPEQAAPPPR